MTTDPSLVAAGLNSSLFESQAENRWVKENKASS